MFLSGINNDVIVLLPFLERYKHSANFHDVMNSASAFYSTNQIAEVMEYSTYRYWNTEVFVVTSWLHHGYIMVTSPSSCYTSLFVFLGPHPLV